MGHRFRCSGNLERAPAEVGEKSFELGLLWNPRLGPNEGPNLGHQASTAPVREADMVGRSFSSGCEAPRVKRASFARATRGPLPKYLPEAVRSTAAIKGGCYILRTGPI